MLNIISLSLFKLNSLIERVKLQIHSDLGFNY